MSAVFNFRLKFLVRTNNLIVLYTFKHINFYCNYVNFKISLINEIKILNLLIIKYYIEIQLYKWNLIEYTVINNNKELNWV